VAEACLATFQLLACLPDFYGSLVQLVQHPLAEDVRTLLTQVLWRIGHATRIAARAAT